MTVAWSAGLITGDGWIGNRRLDDALVLDFSLCDEGAVERGIEELLPFIGARRHSAVTGWRPNTKLLPSGKTLFSARVTGPAAEPILQELMPWLRGTEKGEQALVAFARAGVVPTTLSRRPTLEWAAGLFVAEGTYYVYRNPGTWRAKPGLAMQMYDRGAVQQFADLVGCESTRFSPKTRVWRMAPYGDEAARIANLLTPHLVGTDKERQIARVTAEVAEVNAAALEGRNA